MNTRNRIKFSEKQAALIWQQVVGKELTSLEDEIVSVIYPGRTNGDNGPDFRDAVIVNKSHLTKGDVEVHVKSSDLFNLAPYTIPYIQPIFFQGSPRRGYFLRNTKAARG